MLIIKKHQHWKKVSGWIKLANTPAIYFSNEFGEDWIETSTLVAFPLQENETIESAFEKFVEYDLNARAIYKLKVSSVKNVVVIE